MAWLQYVVPMAILLLGLALRAWDPVMIGDQRLRVFDYYQELKPRTYQPLPVRIVDLDDESFARHGQWPWPRIILARLVDRLAETGAATIVFDIVFAEPDRTSPAQIFELWPKTLVDEALRSRARGLKSHDELFADAIRNAGNVVLGFALTPGNGGMKPLYRGGYAHTGHDPRLFVPRFGGSVVNLAGIAAAAAGSGSMNVVPERDGMVRRVPLLVNFEDKVYPALPLEILRVAQGASTILVKSSGASGEDSFGRESGVVGVRAGRISAPTDAQGRTWLYQTREQDVRYIPAWQVLSGKFDRKKIEGSIVFVGTSAAGLADLKPTALHPSLPGVAVHAQIAEQLILGSFLTRPDWADGAELVFLLIVGAIIVLFTPRLGAAWAALIAAACAAGGIGASWHAFSDPSLRLLVDPIYPVFVVVLVYLSGAVMSYLRAEQGRRQMRTWFSLYVSRKLVDRLAANPDEVSLGGETRELSIMFTDVRGFTTISEHYGRDVQGLTNIMNRYMTAMSESILENQGTIDKYIGDAQMAFWNAPLDDLEHANKSIETALKMMKRLDTFNDEILQERIPPFGMGIGINTGEVVVGNMGSDMRFDYTCLGDAVNLAARLEGQSKTYAVDIVIGEETVKQVSKHHCIELDRLVVKGKTKPVSIYTVFDHFYDSEKHEKFLETYRRQDWESACTIAGDLRYEFDGKLNGYYEMMIDRIENYKNSTLPASWGGEFVSVTK